VDCFAQFLIPTASEVSALNKASKRSANKQTGAPSSTTGTTSALSQPLSLLSLASEYGGLTTSTNNGTFTVQTALDQIASALAKDHLIDICRSGTEKIHCLKERYLDAFHRFSTTATFNTANSSKTVNTAASGAQQGNTQPVSLTASGGQAPSLSAVTFKYVLVNDKADAESPWRKAVTNSATNENDVTKLAQALNRSVATLSQISENNFYYAKWQYCIREILKSTALEKLEAQFLNSYSQLYGILIKGEIYSCPNVALDQQAEQNITGQGFAKPAAPQPTTGIREALLEVQGALDKYLNQIRTLRNSVTNPVLAIEYDLNRPQGQPTNSVFKVILSKNTKNSKWTFTGNFAASIYNAEPAATIPGASILRDIQAGAEADRILPSIPLVGQTTLSGAYYFQAQTSPSILNVTPATPITGITFTGLPSSATQVFTQKGDIHLAQLKWALGTGKNIRFPLAVSYSNRTELIQKPDWRGQFGISYDFSAVFSGQGSSN
jgi:hypothetical protein